MRKFQCGMISVWCGQCERKFHIFFPIGQNETSNLFLLLLLGFLPRIGDQQTNSTSQWTNKKHAFKYSYFTIRNGEWLKTDLACTQWAQSLRSNTNMDREKMSASIYEEKRGREKNSLHGNKLPTRSMRVIIVIILIMSAFRSCQNIRVGCQNWNKTSLA